MSAQCLGSFPKLIAFDLDATVWAPEMYELWGGGAPFKAVKTGSTVSKLVDKAGREVFLLEDIQNILSTIVRWNAGVKIAWVSCCDEPSWADECLKLFTTADGALLNSICDSSQIFKANKQTHFARLKAQFPDISYDEMIFFDNEEGNIRNVEKIGVHCIYCPEGINAAMWNQTLQKYADYAADKK